MVAKTNVVATTNVVTTPNFVTTNGEAREISGAGDLLDERVGDDLYILFSRNRRHVRVAYGLTSLEMP